MRVVILALILVTGCYEKKDATRDLRELGVPGPYACINVSTKYRQIYHCNAGDGHLWECADDGCVRMGP